MVAVNSRSVEVRKEKEMVCMKKTIRFSLFAVVAVFVVIAFGTVGRIHATPAFTDASIEGSWGFHAFGNNTSRGVAIVAVGRIIYDGKGGCEVRDTINFDAQGSTAAPPPTGISRVSAGCDYHTEPDGTGTVHIDFSGPGANGAPDNVHLAFVIEDRGNFMRLVRTDQVAIAQGTSSRQGFPRLPD